jgi:GTPase
MAKVVKGIKRRSKGSKSTNSNSIMTNDGKLVGRVTHYYSNISVAVVEVNSIMKKGDQIKIGKSDFFKQSVRSMQFKKERIESARKGKEIGLRVYKKVRVNDRIFKV